MIDWREEKNEKDSNFDEISELESTVFYESSILWNTR